jgi:hypothetical protein
LELASGWGLDSVLIRSRGDGLDVLHQSIHGLEQSLPQQDPTEEEDNQEVPQKQGEHVDDRLTGGADEGKEEGHAHGRHEDPAGEEDAERDQ